MTERFFKGHAIVANFAPDIPKQVAADADAIENALLDPASCSYSPQNVTRLSGPEASAAALIATLNELRSRPVDEPVLFYFSGHGFSDAGSGKKGLVLAPTYEDPSGGSMLAEDFVDHWRRLPARRKVVILDSCHAGGMPAVKAAAGTGSRSEYLELDPSLLEAGHGSAVLASSASDQKSVVLPGDDLSLFTKHLIRGLGGGVPADGDGYVTLFGLFDYVKTGVSRENPAQTPILSTNELSENFRLAFSPAREAADENLGVGGNLDDDVWGRIEKVLSKLYPMGPREENIWTRAGGELARVDLSGSGRQQWRSSLRLVRNGGGGSLVSLASIVSAALDDFAQNHDLRSLISDINVENGS